MGIYKTLRGRITQVLREKGPADSEALAKELATPSLVILACLQIMQTEGLVIPNLDVKDQLLKPWKLP